MCVQHQKFRKLNNLKVLWSRPIKRHKLDDLNRQKLPLREGCEPYG